jgi:hypothetical protein
MSEDFSGEQHLLQRLMHQPTGTVLGLPVQNLYSNPVDGACPSGYALTQR